MERFEGQTVVVTGGSGGMGSSHVRGYHAEGANVVIAGRDDDAGRDLAARLGQRALSVHLDVTSEADWAALVREVEDHFGPITILVNNAGIQNPAALVEHTELRAWEQTFGVNVTGQFLGIRAVAPSMRRGGGGSIVNVASTMAHVGTAFYAPYTASKWAVRGLTKTAALELGRDNIRVNSIHPGVVSTPLIHEPTVAGQPAIADLYSPDPFAIPRLAEPSDVTRLLLFITSQDASFATGSEFVLDGGLLLGPALRPESDIAA
ncbi:MULTISPECIES: SDR family NAD(P)-dependent oxidoreductase [unclassified Streptomyces]|uniref:SDR family NAD(P)-dependent oxidoreductase n=1 Tax=unclassified Streptomyces TaxID=2593676 RepID=UPI0007485758|nr:MULTISPECIES: SDR family oxidoreductase [unclassified Streptomyces]KUL76222.1 3-alpha-hydroxysteroid dehydrogenase [Streptomyces sp. NRRL WC-3604]KUL78850.1 3-alpha-hydroxysteroid dehydrogenase [Streptomyces sp. NRRL WC-3605]